MTDRAFATLSAAAVAGFAERAGRLDGLVNNAAVTRTGLLATLSLDAAGEQLRINLLGPIACIKAVLPTMMGQRSGVRCTAAVSPSRTSPAAAIRSTPPSFGASRPRSRNAVRSCRSSCRGRRHGASSSHFATA